MKIYPFWLNKAVSAVTRVELLGPVVFALLTAFLVMSSGCGLSGQSSTSYLKDCVVNADQAGTLSGHWGVTPVPIAFQAGAFTQAEMDEIVTAANTWNSFYASSKGMRMIDYGDAASPRTSTAAKPDLSCSRTLLANGTSFTAPVVLYKSSSWPASYSSSAMAITKFCWTDVDGTRAHRKFYMSWIDINYQYFFTSGTKKPDIQTIILHEMGHVLGLDHSCEGGGGTGIPNCTASGISQDYLQALMYPVFGFDASGYGQQKRSLFTNDQQRANCLY